MFDGATAEATGENLEGRDLCGQDFSKESLHRANLRNSNLKCVCFEDVDLRGADLTGAELRGANLSGADLRGAILPTHYGPIPVIPDIDAQMLDAIEANPSLFEMGNWHEEKSCGTAHCRAGWAVTLAGPAGRKLEDQIDTGAAAALIYTVSRPNKRVPNFYEFNNNNKTLADIRVCAAEQTASRERKAG